MSRIGNESQHYDSYAVFGNPIQHSKSPFIHTYFAKVTKQSMVYGIEEPSKEAFKESAAAFFANDHAKGANVTLPFKLDAFEFADHVTEQAQRANAVNTLIKQPNGQIRGDTTDGKGLVYDLHRQFGDLLGGNLLIIGAGGAARGVIEPLFEAGVRSIHVANRTVDNANFLVGQFSQFGDLSASGLNDVPEKSFNIIINSTSSSMTKTLPDISECIFSQASIAYDMFYSNEVTRFNTWAMAHNVAIKTSDGLGMLVGQALESFKLWRDVAPSESDVSTLIDDIKQQLSAR